MQFIMSEIFQLINISTAQGTGRYTVAAHTEIIISKTNVGGKNSLQSDRVLVLNALCVGPSLGKITASAV